MLERIQRWGEILLAAVFLVAAGFLIFIAYWILSNIYAASGPGLIQPYYRIGYCIALLFELLAVFGLVPIVVQIMVPQCDNDEEDDGQCVFGTIILERYDTRGRYEEISVN